MPNYSSIVVPKTAKIAVSHSHKLGTSDYDLEELWSPDTDIWRSKVLEIGSPKYSPNTTYAFDRSRYQNHGTITGAVWQQLDSGVWVLKFDGTDDFLSVPNNSSLDVTTGLTIIAWIKSGGGAGSVSGIVSRWNGVQGYEMTQNDDASIDFRIGDGTTAPGLSARVNYSANVWTHLTLTFNQPDGKAYVNGVLDAATLTMNNPIQNLNDVMYICRRISTGVFWTGTFGEARVKNRALTANEIVHDYLATKWRYA